jgi:hypothetical protein
MTAVATKAAHVRSAGQTRAHTCHWPGCDRQCPPAMWGCRQHWFTLPAEIRSRIWRAYQIGQEQTGRPSHAYVAAAHAAQEWIHANFELARPPAVEQAELPL